MRSHILAARSLWVTITRVALTRLCDIPQQGEDLLSGDTIQISGRLVGQQHAGVSDKGASDRGSLALSARELIGQVTGPLTEPDVGQRARHARMNVVFPESLQIEGHRDILLARERRQQMIGLKDVGHL